jgi:uncharacterized protein
MSLHHAAEQGEVNSQFELGRCFREGDSNVEKNLAKSIYWYGKAAEQGDTEAMFELGNIYYTESPDHFSEAMKWYLQASEAGHVESMHSLGVMHLNGEVVVNKYMKLVWVYILRREQLSF